MTELSRQGFGTKRGLTSASKPRFKTRLTACWAAATPAESRRAQRGKQGHIVQGGSHHSACQRILTLMQRLAVIESTCGSDGAEPMPAWTTGQLPDYQRQWPARSAGQEASDSTFTPTRLVETTAGWLRNNDWSRLSRRSQMMFSLIRRWNALRTCCPIAVYIAQSSC